MLSAMAYTVMKLHKRYLIPMESLDEFCNYLQIKLEKDFCFDDDAVISMMERSMEELKRSKLDYPGPPLLHELPRFPFGTFKEPSFTSKVKYVGKWSFPPYIISISYNARSSL